MSTDSKPIQTASIRIPVGAQIGSWTVIGEYFKSGKNYRAKCRCICGVEREVLTFAMLSGMSNSCGCLGRIGYVAHGRCRTVEYHCWIHIKDRCHNPKSNGFYNYGARGIIVCKRWRTSFQEFLKDMGTRPEGTTSIERRNVNGDYAPSNCYWATDIEQANNTRRNRVLTFQGKTQTLAMWVRQSGLKYSTVKCRLEYGWTVEEALTEPPKQTGRIY